MANRYLEQFQPAFEKQLVNISLKINIAAGGAVSSFTGKGVSTVAQNGAGTYDITLEDTYNDYRAIHATVLNANGEDLVPQIVSANVTSTKLIKINLLAAAVATNPTNATELLVTIFVKNSGV